MSEQYLLPQHGLARPVDLLLGLSASIKQLGRHSAPKRPCPWALTEICMAPLSSLSGLSSHGRDFHAGNRHTALERLDAGLGGLGLVQASNVPHEVPVEFRDKLAVESINQDSAARPGWRAWGQHRRSFWRRRILLHIHRLG